MVPDRLISGRGRRLRRPASLRLDPLTMVDGERGAIPLSGQIPWKWENLPTPMERYVHDFDEAAELGRDLLGGKGAGLAEMTAIGIPVPAGFIVTTEACLEYRRGGREMPDGLEDEVRAHLGRLEKTTGKRFGDAEDPSSFRSVRAPPSRCPGMMDTILNLGLNDEAAQGLARTTGNERFARDAYRRLVQMYGNVVDGVDADAFEQELSALKEERGRRRTSTCRPRISSSSWSASSASTATPRGRTSRRTLRSSFVAPSAPSSTRGTTRARRYTAAPTTSPDDLGTAVSVVQMVFGNKGACLRRASPSRATPPPESKASGASS